MGLIFFAPFSNLFVKKVVQDLTSGGIDWQREKWQSGLGSKFIHQGEKNAAKYADEVIVLSKGVQDYFKETYGRETHFIPNGVNRPQIREASLITDKFGLKKDSYILFLGRLVPEKGIRYLVEAFKNVKTDKKLVIAGGSSDTDSFMEELKELAKGDDRILFTGFVQGAMLDELYSNAYIYTLPSDLEGISAVLKFYLKGIVQSIIKGDRIKDCVDPNDPKQRKENFLRFNEQIVNRTKEAYGRYRNVFLEDYSELEMEIAELDTLIEDLSAYMQSTGRKYADHAATLRSWSARKKRQQKPGAGIPDYTYNKEESL